jgi:Coenzyme PQQ synthesis protein D (PqqD)
MLAPENRFVVNTPAVAAKVIEGEAIIMNLSTGMYYSMDGVGALLWEWIDRGHSVGEIVEGIAAHYEAPTTRVRPDVERLVEEAMQEGLVSLAGTNGDHARAIDPRSDPRLPYQAPQLVRYSDMAELLALDPPMPMPAAPWSSPEKHQ